MCLSQLTINAIKGQEELICEKLQEYEGVVRTLKTLRDGSIIIAEVITDDEEHLERFVSNEIARIPGIKSTKRKILTAE